MFIIKGNGKQVIKSYNVSSFLNLHLSINGLIELNQSGEEKVEIETDKNMFDYISVVNSGKTLFIISDSGYKRLEFTNIKVRVFLRQINKLSIRCDAGEVVCANIIKLSNPVEVKIQSIGDTGLKIDAPALKLLLQNKGNTTLAGKCAEAEIKMQADGNLFAKDLIAGDLRVKNTSTGNVEVFANRTISIAHYGEGYLHYYGNAVLLDVKQFGLGEVKHINQEKIN